MSADERVGTAIRERLAADLAVRGGRLALEYFHRAQVSWKPDGSMVTARDHDTRSEGGSEPRRLDQSIHFMLEAWVG